MLFFLCRKMAAIDSTMSKHKSTFEKSVQLTRTSVARYPNTNIAQKFSLLRGRNYFCIADLSVSLRVCNSGAGPLLNTLPVYWHTAPGILERFAKYVA